MGDTELLLRRAMLAVATLVGIGTMGELALLDHVGSPPQVIPFVVIGIGLVAVGAAWVVPSRPTLRTARGVAVLLLVASTFGVFEHLEHNFAFEAEIRPEALASELVVPTILGANPALAPGAVAVMGLLLALATLRDPRIARG